MEPRFQVETRHNEAAYRAMATVHFLRHTKNKHSLAMLYGLVAVLGVLMWFLTADGNYGSLRALGSGLLVLGVGALVAPYLDRFSAGNVCKRLSDNLIKGAKKGKTFGIPTRYRFYEDRLEASDGAGTIVTPYDKVTDSVETEAFFLFFDKDGRCTLFSKEHFTIGDADGLRDFLGEKGRKPELFLIENKK